MCGFLLYQTTFSLRVSGKILRSHEDLIVICLEWEDHWRALQRCKLMLYVYQMLEIAAAILFTVKYWVVYEKMVKKSRETWVLLLFPWVMKTLSKSLASLLWPVDSLGKTLLAFALLHSVFQDQICLLLQVFLDFLLLHSSPLWESLGLQGDPTSPF